MAKTRRRHTAAYKFRVALEALESRKTISQLSSEHEVHANLMRAWKRQLQACLTHYFDFYNHERPHHGLNYRTPTERHYAL